MTNTRSTRTNTQKCRKPKPPPPPAAATSVQQKQRQPRQLDDVDEDDGCVSIDRELAQSITMLREMTDAQNEKLNLSMEAHKRELYQGFLVEMTKLSHNIKNMTVKDFNDLYDCDLLDLTANAYAWTETDEATTRGSGTDAKMHAAAAGTRTTTKAALRTPATWTTTTRSQRTKLNTTKKNGVALDDDDDVYQGDVTVTVKKNQLQVKGRTLDLENDSLVENMSPATIAQIQHFHNMTSAVLSKINEMREAKEHHSLLK